MKELALQDFIVDTVNDAGGFAHKMSNRFLVGVADLMVKLPNKPAGVLEVKQRDYPGYKRGEFELDVTHLQKTYLSRATQAGMPAGVASFLQEGTGSGLTLWLRILPWTRTFKNTDKIVFASTGGYTLLGNHRTRTDVLLTVLYNWHDEWKWQNK